MRVATYLRARDAMLSRAKQINRASNYTEPHSYCERAARMHHMYVLKRNVPDATLLLFISLTGV